MCQKMPECARMCHECAPECANSNLLFSKPYVFIATPAATAVQYGPQKRSTCFQFECAPTAPRMCHRVCQLGLTLNKTCLRCEPKSRPSCCTRWRCSATVTRESCRAYVHTGCVVPTCLFCARAVTEGAHERNRSPWRRINSSLRLFSADTAARRSNCRRSASASCMRRARARRRLSICGRRCAFAFARTWRAGADLARGSAMALGAIVHHSNCLSHKS